MKLPLSKTNHTQKKETQLLQHLLYLDFTSVSIIDHSEASTYRGVYHCCNVQGKKIKAEEISQLFPSSIDLFQTNTKIKHRGRVRCYWAASPNRLNFYRSVVLHHADADMAFSQVLRLIARKMLNVIGLVSANTDIESLCSCFVVLEKRRLYRTTYCSLRCL